MSTPYKPNTTSKLITPGANKQGQLSSSDLSRILPRQLSSGSTRGTQTVGYGNTKIDGTNNTITIAGPDGSVVGMGAIPGSTTNEYGFFTLDTGGNLILKIVGGTIYVYDPANDYVNVEQNGLLPDGSGGLAVAKPGENVADAF